MRHGGLTPNNKNLMHRANRTVHQPTPGGGKAIADIHTLAGAIYGPRWQSALAREMRVNVRTVQRWAADPDRVEPWVIQWLEARRTRSVAAPPKESAAADDRDDALYCAVAPHVEAMVAAIEAAGWSDGEAVLGPYNVIVDMMLVRAASPAVIETLKQTIQEIKNVRDT